MCAFRIYPVHTFGQYIEFNPIHYWGSFFIYTRKCSQRNGKIPSSTHQFLSGKYNNLLLFINLSNTGELLNNGSYSLISFYTYLSLLFKCNMQRIHLNRSFDIRLRSNGFEWISRVLQ